MSLGELVANVGFPIGVAVFLLYERVRYNNKLGKKLDKVIHLLELFIKERVNAQPYISSSTKRFERFRE